MTDAPWPPDFDALLRTYLPMLDEAQPLTPDLRLADWGLDSLSTVSLLIDMEEHYAVSIPDELLTMTSFADPAGIWAILEQLGVGEPASGDPVR